MKRDWDLVRDILRRTETETSNAKTLGLSDFSESMASQVAYHVELLIEAGLIDGRMSKALGSSPSHFVIIRLTWRGHEFIDQIRSDSVWDKTKAKFSSEGISMTFDLVKQVALDLAANLLKSG